MKTTDIVIADRFNLVDNQEIMMVVLSHNPHLPKSSKEIEDLLFNGYVIVEDKKYYVKNVELQKQPLTEKLEHQFIGLVVVESVIDKLYTLN